jgi:hypothetical protein
MPTQVVNSELIDLLRPWFCEKPCTGAGCPDALCSPDGLIDPLLQTDNDGGMTWYGDGVDDAYFIFDGASSWDRYIFFDGYSPTDLDPRYINIYQSAPDFDVIYTYHYYVNIGADAWNDVVFNIEGSGGCAGDWDVNNDLQVSANAEIGGYCQVDNMLRLNDYPKTIAAGIISLAGGAGSSYLEIDTQGGAASDDLDTINGGVDGDLIILTAANDARTVVCKDSTGNLRLAGADFSLDSVDDTLMLIYNGANWLEISRSDNG